MDDNVARCYSNRIHFSKWVGVVDVDYFVLLTVEFINYRQIQYNKLSFKHEAIWRLMSIKLIQCDLYTVESYISVWGVLWKLITLQFQNKKIT